MSASFFWLIFLRTSSDLQALCCSVLQCVDGAFGVWMSFSFCWLSFSSLSYDFQEYRRVVARLESGWERKREVTERKGERETA